MKTHIIKTILISIAISILIGIVYAAYVGVTPQTSEASPSDNLSGFAWSDTIGWISMNSTSDGSSSPYGVTVAPSGAISGYAWSEHIGWVSFNASDVSGCPSGPCAPTLNKTTGEVTGWAKTLSGGGANSGGWDGYISLSGSNYGVTASDCNWTGWAWGSDVVGWVNFGGNGGTVTGTGDACVTPPATCTGSIPNNASSCSTDEPAISTPYRVLNSCAFSGLSKCDYECASASGYIPDPLFGQACRLAQCSDGIDNDTDGLTDFSSDTGCTSPTDDNEAAGFPTINSTARAVQEGDTVDISWDLNGQVGCTLTANGILVGVDPNVVTLYSPTVNARTTFTIDCPGGGDSVIVEVTPRGYET